MPDAPRGYVTSYGSLALPVAPHLVLGWPDISRSPSVLQRSYACCAAHPCPSSSTPTKVLGVDDFSWRRGVRYGTILCDLEHRRPLAVLPECSVATFAGWLEQHPGVQIISRDRGGIYAEGARRGAPAAEQVADRWHLLKNLGDALERYLIREQQVLFTGVTRCFAVHSCASHLFCTSGSGESRDFPAQAASRAGAGAANGGKIRPRYCP